MRVVRENLPASAYPIRIEALHPETEAVVWSRVVERPGSNGTAALYIPPLRKQLGHPVVIRVTLASGLPGAIIRATAATGED
jgi:hypothetical protein